MRPARASLATAIALLLVATSCQGGGGDPIPPPPTTVVSVTSPPDPPDLAGVVLPELPGRSTTTRVVLTPGRAVLSGQVVGPDGPVAGATVRVERLVDDAIGFLEVLTAPDGTWQAPAPPNPPPPADPAAPPTPAPRPTPAPIQPTGLLGGRYRVRAWRSPDLSLTAPTVLFLGGAENKQLPLQLSRYSGLGVTSNVAPSPPVVGELVNLAILVTTRSVDPNGVVRSLGIPGAAVSLLGGAGWQVVRADSDTDDGGRASFQLRCRSEGSQPLGVNVNGTATFSLSIPPCVLAPPSTTSSLPTEEEEEGPSSTTSTTDDPPERSTTSSSRSTSTTTRPGPTTP